MIGAFLIAMLVEAGIFSWLWKESLLAQAQAHALEATRLTVFAQSALESMQAKSITEKVQAENLRKQYDVRTEMYRDAVAKQYENKPKTEKVEPKWVVTDTGTKIDFNDVEWLDS